MKPAFKAVMFDLDGTLLDTLADIASAGNHVLATLNLPQRPMRDYRYLAGQGAPWLVEQILGPDHAAQHAHALSLFQTYLMQHGLDQTQPYPGIADMLDELIRRNLTLTVLSNKPEHATQHAVRQRLGRWRFAAVAGHRHEPGAPAVKPDPIGALQIAAQLNIAPANWLYLGDTRVDMLTAQAAGFFAVGATWGFRDEAELRDAGADVIVHHPSEVIALLDHPRLRK